MDHSRYENWLFEPELLTPEQRNDLDSHLTTCKECAQLNRKLGVITNLLSEPVFVAPAPGFSLRFQDKLRLENEKHQKKQTLLFTMALGAIAFVAIIGFVVYRYSMQSPILILVSILQSVADLYIRLGKVRQFIQMLITTLPPVVTFSIWVGITSALTFIVMLWGAVLYRFTWKGVVSK